MIFTKLLTSLKLNFLICTMGMIIPQLKQITHEVGLALFSLYSKKSINVLFLYICVYEITYTEN